MSSGARFAHKLAREIREQRSHARLRAGLEETMRGLPEERAADLIEKLRSHGHATEADLIVQIRDA